MKTPFSGRDEFGFLGIVDGIKSLEKGRVIKADLEDLPGVHHVEILEQGARIRFDPDIVNERQFEEAVRIAGFQASGFQMAA